MPEPIFTPVSFGADKADLRRPVFTSIVTGGGSPPPSESPLKVWNGTEWVSTGVTVED